MASAPNVFVDTTLLIRADDGRDPAKRRVARDWLGRLWRERRGRVSTEVLNEYYAAATQWLGPTVSRGDIRAEVRRYQRWQPWVTDHQTVETAWALEARVSLPWRQALIAAAALHQQCAWLLSEDLPHDLRIDGLRVINPFLVGPEVLADVEGEALA